MSSRHETFVTEKRKEIAGLGRGGGGRRGYRRISQEPSENIERGAPPSLVLPCGGKRLCAGLRFACGTSLCTKENLLHHRPSLAYPLYGCAFGAVLGCALCLKCCQVRCTLGFGVTRGVSFFTQVVAVCRVVWRRGATCVSTR